MLNTFVCKSSMKSKLNELNANESNFVVKRFLVQIFFAGEKTYTPTHQLWSVKLQYDLAQR